jgi:hypothetical protein
MITQAEMDELRLESMVLVKGELRNTVIEFLGDRMEAAGEELRRAEGGRLGPGMEAPGGQEPAPVGPPEAAPPGPGGPPPGPAPAGQPY